MKNILVLALLLLHFSLAAQTTTQKNVSKNDSKPDTISNEASLEEGPPMIDTEPAFIGDLNAYLQTNLRYPADAKRKRVTGAVEVLFFVNKNGILSDISISKSLYPSLDSEALRLVRAMPIWTPAKYENKFVESWSRVVISFNL